MIEHSTISEFCLRGTLVPLLAKLTVAIERQIPTQMYWTPSLCKLLITAKITITCPLNHIRIANQTVLPLSFPVCSYSTSLKGTCVWRWLKMANTKTCTSRRERYPPVLSMESLVNYLWMCGEPFCLVICRCSCYQLGSLTPPRERPTPWAWWWRGRGCWRRPTVSGFLSVAGMSFVSTVTLFLPWISAKRCWRNVAWWFQVLRGQQHRGPVWEMVLLREPGNPARTSHQRVSCSLPTMISHHLTLSDFPNCSFIFRFMASKQCRTGKPDPSELPL